MDGDPLLPRLAGIVLDEQVRLTLDELSRACAARDERILELIEEGALLPEGEAPPAWRFTSLHVRHARIATRLQRDLGVNAAGAALALQLLEEIALLRARIRGAGEG